MMSRRLQLLTAALGALVLLRWWVPVQAPAQSEVVEASQRTAHAVDWQPKPESPTPPNSELASVRLRETASVPPGAAGNIFAVRKPASTTPSAVVLAAAPMPPAVPAHPAMAPAQPLPVIASSPPPEVPVPPTPLEVIGTWNDSGAPGVFIAWQHGTVLARPGSVLLSEYRVLRISPQQVSLLHLASQREWDLPIPQVPPSQPRP